MSLSLQDPPTEGDGARTAADGDRVVISGIAGLYPQARYVTDLENILYNKINPINADSVRWVCKHPEVAKYAGNIPELNFFDAHFFKTHARLVLYMDPTSRKMLELAYEAIYDAGLHPLSLSGKKVAVYTGITLSEVEKSHVFDSYIISGLGLVGCTPSMFSNRISYWLNLKGPSMCFDQSGCSSLTALQAACRAINSGECEAAFALSGNVCFGPQASAHYGRMMTTSKDGNTKSFAEDGEGFQETEAINCLFLQKAKDAKRIYAEVIHVKSEFCPVGYGEIGPRFGFYREPAVTANFLQKFYEEAAVPPAAVEYIEAFGCAIPEVDKAELEVIDKVFCNKREEPLLVGSVMSNIGYGEAASGLSAVTKVLLGYHKGLLAGNLHCSVPRRDVAALLEGRLRVLTDHTQFRHTYAAVNNLAITGVNAHVLLRGRYKHKDLDRYKTNIPHLVTISGRTDTVVERALDLLKSHPIDPEELALLRSIHETNISGHLGKGYTILDKSSEGKTISLAQESVYWDSSKRPLWFVYSGMGSQWAGMGAQLMRIPIFAAAIERCQDVLKPRGVDLVHIITSSDKAIFNNILYSFVGISAMQIGLTDVLQQLGMVPDKIIGHSMGELGCAYADGCLTTEEMILSSYSRGRVSLETPFISGLMAAVGAGAQSISSMCPPEIEIACHNSADSCTISGPTDAIRSFIADLNVRGIFTKEVPCSNIAYHSRYIAQAGPGLLKYLKEVIRTPRARSERWVSSSVPEDRWGEPAAQYSSAEYHTNNLLSPVLFEEACALIPADAVLVEVAPHGLMQAILKRSQPDSVANVPLMRRSHNDSVITLLDAIGQLYLLGYNPKVDVLYPKVEYPVSTGTPMLSNYVDWAHQEDWPMPYYSLVSRVMSATCTFIPSIYDNCYLKGNIIANKTLLPFSFALVAAWDTLAMSVGAPKKSLDVQFRHLKLNTQPILHEQRAVRLTVTLHRGSGWFEITDANSKVATGFINIIESANDEDISSPEYTLKVNSNSKWLNAEDVYQILNERGYAYSGTFRSIHSTNCSISEANIWWADEWVTFIDGMLQLNTLKYASRSLSQPDRIGKMVIEPTRHTKSLNYKNGSEDASSLLHFNLCDIQNRSSCGGVSIENIRFRDVLQSVDDRIILHSLKFIPRFNSHFDVSSSLYILLQIVAENISKEKINIVGLKVNHHAQVFEEMEKIAQDGLPGTKIQYQNILVPVDSDVTGNERLFENVDVVLTQNLSKNDSVRLELARWKPSTAPTTSAFTVRTESDLPLLEAVRNTCSQNGFLVVTSNPPVAGLINLVKQWKRDASHSRIHVIMHNENYIENINFDEVPDLVYNVFSDGLWGGEYFLPVKETLSGDNMALHCELVGDLSSLRWKQVRTEPDVSTLVTVQYTGINTVDAKRALGLISYDNVLYSGFGMDYSGITESGERVMGVAISGAARSVVAAAPELSWPVPPHWTLEDAATVPFAYLYAYYCTLNHAHLIDKEKLKQFSLLVHGGAGALGQACISVALARGWRVFTTVADAGKKRFLAKLFPELNEGDICRSRDTSFADTVLCETNGIGCNMVICCLKGALREASLRCLAPFCKFIDTRQLISNEDFTFGMDYLSFENTFMISDIMNILSNLQSNSIRKTLHELVSLGIASGEVRPLSRVTFAADEASRAFRMVAASRHRGRTLLRLRDSPAPATPRNASGKSLQKHVIICGSNLLGMRLADTLISSGIRKLHLLINASTGYLQFKLREWEKYTSSLEVNFEEIDDVNKISQKFCEIEKLGPVEGLYFIADNEAQENVLNNIDMSTRNCASLGRFMVISTNGQIGYNTCAQRARDELPATLLDWSRLKKEGAWSCGAATAMQRALVATDSLLVAQPQKPTGRSLIQQLADCADISINCQTLSNETLEDLGVPYQKLLFINTFLRDVYNTCIVEDDIPRLTLEDLNQIDKRSIPGPLKELKGLEIFFSVVDSDEIHATTEIVYLQTLSFNYEVKEEEFDASETFLCIVPGLEGHHARFRTLCERLKLSALVLQPGLDHPDHTPKQLAARYAQVLFKRTCLKNTFYILGYETGVIVALELAAVLEEHGLSGTVFCLGDGPSETAALVESSLRAFPSEEALQCGVARHMCSLMAPGSGADVERALRGRSSWAARVDACVRSLRGHVPHSAQYARALMDAAYVRLGAARRPVETTAPQQLRSRLVLLRAADGREPAPNSLQRYSRQELHVRQLAAPMAHAAADLFVSAIINSFLDDELLQAFEKKNLCDSYIFKDFTKVKVK